MIPECTGGQIYNSCGSACTKTCDDPMPRCSKQCVPKCECPSSMPILYGSYICMEQNRCPAVEVQATEGESRVIIFYVDYHFKDFVLTDV